LGYIRPSPQRYQRIGHMVSIDEGSSHEQYAHEEEVPAE
jgi:hypothetical protein